MNWFKFATQDMSNPLPMSRQRFEQMMQRIFNVVREYEGETQDPDTGLNLRTWKQWWEHYGDEHVEMHIMNDGDVYNMFMSDLANDEGISVEALCQAYRNNQLPNENVSYQQSVQLPIQPTGFPVDNPPWARQQPKEIDKKAAMALYQQANSRVTDKTRAQVQQARYQLFLAYNSDPALAEKLGLPPSTVNARIRGWSGTTAESHKLEQRLNANIPPEHQWAGIGNLAWISQANFSHEDLDKFVNSIQITEGSRSFYGSDKGMWLRRNIARTFLGIDTRISYKDLNFVLGEITVKGNGSRDSTPRGLYQNSEKKITISDNNPHTVAHEIGHYLDYKFAQEIGFGQCLSETPVNWNAISTRVPAPKVAWYKKMKDFMGSLVVKGSLQSRYTQEPKEIFARFVDKFVRWTSQAAGQREYDDHGYYDDKFDVRDFHQFVRLLQEKSYIDASASQTQKG